MRDRRGDRAVEIFPDFIFFRAIARVNLVEIRRFIPHTRPMKKHQASKKPGYLKSIRQWFYGTPNRSLDLAYRAALKIEEIEKKHFHGNAIVPDVNETGESVSSYFTSELQRNLGIIKVRLAEFRNSRSFLDILQQTIDPQSKIGETHDGYYLNSEELGQEAVLILDKLNFIDRVLQRYEGARPAEKPRDKTAKPPTVKPSDSSALSASQGLARTIDPYAIDTPPEGRSSNANNNTNLPNKTRPRIAEDTTKDLGPISNQTSFLPRSILRTLDRVKRELDPKAEEEVVQEFRSSKTKTVISLKFILLIILIPLLTQQVSKNFIVGPIYDRVVGGNGEIFINVDMEEEAFVELHRYKEKLEFKNLIAKELEHLSEDTNEELNFKNTLHPLSEEEIEDKVKHKVLEIAEQYSKRSADAIQNIFADIFSFVAFGMVIYTSKREIEILKSFIDDLVYGLSDSAKAFIIILFTDIFVGFHSPHGWEVILEGISRHLGLPESREFIFLFIATFPVILDTVFKYWIFRYLNRISPSAVATYRNMNE